MREEPFVLSTQNKTDRLKYKKIRSIPVELPLAQPDWGQHLGDTDSNIMVIGVAIVTRKCSIRIRSETNEHLVTAAELVETIRAAPTIRSNNSHSPASEQITLLPPAHEVSGR